MNRTKKIIAGLTCGLLLTATLQLDTAYAASLSASADTGSAAKGEYVNVSVDLSSNPSISTLGAALDYDSSVLKYDSSTWGGGFSGSDMQMASDTGGSVNLSVVCNDTYSADGTVVTVRFQAVKDTSSIPVTLSLREMADANLAAVSDCQVASTVRAPQPVQKPEENNDFVDLQDPDAASGVSVVDEEMDPEDLTNDTGAGTDDGTGNGSGSKTSGTVNGGGAGTDSQTASGAEAGSSTGTGSDVSVGMSGESDTQTRLASASTDGTETARLDLNYKTGAGIGHDIYLIGAAVFGMLALVLVIRRYKDHQ